ncbi:toll/interleukin-1 receptor domain-containing protein [Arthrobacter sp. GAS37]|uniref:toll/interleukin-1 receptor domain-containing protein n=1 Tax=Arthrobacter sp. GAS37 TaxID=3156261 RepID=UPI003850A8C5
MLSYASADRDRATLVADSLRSQGFSVWMDTAAREAAGLELPGIPSGQQHWPTITDAIDEASTFLVLETRAWHASEYCRREHEYARSLGKRIAALGMPHAGKPIKTIARGPEEDPQCLITLLSAGDETAAIHARLVSELNSIGKIGTGRSRINRPQIRDAEFLSTAPLSQLGMSTNDILQERITQLLRAGRRRRRQLRGAALSFLAILLTLSVVSVLAWQQASLSNAAASERASYVTSLQLAQQALHADTTAASLDLAQRGVNLSDNEATHGALKAVQASAYRSTAVITAGVPSAAAVANDGQTALVVQGDSLYVVEAIADGVAKIPFDGRPKSRLAMSPDGQTGYTLDTSNNLICINVKERRATVTPQQNVISISLAPDGAIWWLDKEGELFRSESCPTGAKTATATGINATIAFLVADSSTRLFTLTDSGEVEIRALPEAGRPVGAPLHRTVLSSIPLEGSSSVGDVPDLSKTNAILQCGDTIHVVAGFKKALGADVHVAFSADGEATSPRTVSTPTAGIGCTMKGQAWAAPTLLDHAIALPASAAYPTDEIDSRDRQSRVVIANSPDSGHTVVVHPDGRVDFLTVSKERWAEAADHAAVAVPLAKGIVIIDTDGTVKLKTTTDIAPIGSLGAPPNPETAATADTAYVAAGDKVFAISSHGISRSVALPGPAHAVSLSPDSRTVVISGPGYVDELDADLASSPRQLSGAGLPDGELVSSVTVDGTRRVLGTDYGRVLVADSSGGILAQASTGVAGITKASVLPDHNIVVVGGDGTIRRYSPDLKLLTAHLFGPMAVGLQVSQDGGTLLISLSGNFSVWAVDAATLEPIAKVATRTQDIRLVNVSADGHTVVQLIPQEPSTASPARMVRTQL